MSLLASIFVFGEFWVIAQYDRGFQTDWGYGIRREGGSNEPNELPLDPPLKSAQQYTLLMIITEADTISHLDHV